MATFTTRGGTQPDDKDRGTGQLAVFSRGWPLDADAWEPQLFHPASNGFRRVAHDRRGYGRPSQSRAGHD